MNDCQECQELYSAWLDGEASPSEISRMQAHVLGCPACKQMTSELESLSQQVRDDQSDYLRLSSNAMAELVLSEPEQARLLPTPREFALSKLIPSLAAAGWAALVVKEPGVLKFWPLLALVIFMLGLNRAKKVRPVSLSSGWEQALAPMHWGLLAAACLSTSALCYRENSSHVLEGVVAGLGVWEAAAAACLLGIVARVNPAAWRKLRILSWLLFALLVMLSFMASSEWLVVTLLVLAAALPMVVKFGLRQTSLEHEALPFQYPPALTLLDGSAVALGFLFAEGGAELTVSRDIHLNELNVSGTIIPLLLLLWWILVRTPLASLYGLCQGLPLRCALAGAFGLMLAVPTILLTSSASRLALQIGLPLMGVFLAYAWRQQPCSRNRRIRLRRLITWLPAAALSLLMTTAWHLHVPAEPEQAQALRQSAELRPLPQGENGYDWITWEVINGLDATVQEPQDDIERARTLGLLRRNFEHIDRCLQCPDFRSPFADLTGQPGSRNISQALWLRAQQELDLGKLDSGLTQLLRLASWEQRLHCNGRPREWWLPGKEFSLQLCISLSGKNLSAVQTARLWEGLHCEEDYQQAALHQIDLDYLHQWSLSKTGSGDWSLISPPTAYYDLLTREKGQRYLKARLSLSHLSSETREDLEAFRFCQTALAVLRFRHRTGHLPTSLAEAGLSAPEVRYQPQGHQALLSWKDQLKWHIPSGGQNE
ncbi:zf-HC2 domain-containing protein [bacterium]|nr:zf-HC2 domain-containing protein [bacterium]